MIKILSVVALFHAVFLFLLGVPPFDHLAYHFLTRYHPVARQLKPLYTAQAITTAHAVSTACQLGIFDTLATKSPLSAEEIAAQHKLPLRGVEPLLEALAASDYVYVRTSGKIPLYSNSATAARHLISNLPPAQDMGALVRLLTSLADATGTLTEAVQRGRTVLDVHSEVFPNPKFTLFAQITGPLMHGTAVDMVRLLQSKMQKKLSQTQLRVLDIASGSGEYGYAMAQAFPHSHVTLTDYDDQILKITQQNGHAKQQQQQQQAAAGTSHNFMDRVGFVPGDIMTQDQLTPPNSFDVALIPNLVQMWSRDKSMTLLRKVHDEWIRPGGTVVLVEICRKDTPYSLWEGASPPSRTFGLMGMYMSEDATLYTLEQLLEMLHEAGFVDAQHGGDSFPFACFVTADKKK